MFFNTYFPTPFLQSYGTEYYSILNESSANFKISLNYLLLVIYQDLNQENICEQKVVLKYECKKHELSQGLFIFKHLLIPNYNVI